MVIVNKKVTFEQKSEESEEGVMLIFRGNVAKGNLNFKAVTEACLLCLRHNKEIIYG